MAQGRRANASTAIGPIGSSHWSESRSSIKSRTRAGTGSLAENLFGARCQLINALEATLTEAIFNLTERAPCIEQLRYRRDDLSSGEWLVQNQAIRHAV
jgi:hypothetical protein